MAAVLLLKTIILAFVWSISWIFWFANKAADVTPSRLTIVFGPWLAMLFYILVFWWG